MIPLEQVPEDARGAWMRVRDTLRAMLGDELVAMWGFGGTITAPARSRRGDLDTFIVLHGPVDPAAAEASERALASLSRELGWGLDTWCVLEADARRQEAPHHAWLNRRYETWAIDRAHWLAGRYVPVYGARPEDLVTAPTAEELRSALAAELDHLERHVAAGDTDPYEATYALLNGSRIVHALETEDVAVSKHEGGAWALAHLPGRWHPALQAAMRAYEGEGTLEDEAIIALEMAPFVAMVREQLPDDGR